MAWERKDSRRVHLQENSQFWGDAGSEVEVPVTSPPSATLMLFLTKADE